MDESLQKAAQEFWDRGAPTCILVNREAGTMIQLVRDEAEALERVTSPQGLLFYRGVPVSLDHG